MALKANNELMCR